MSGRWFFQDADKQRHAVLHIVNAVDKRAVEVDAPRRIRYRRLAHLNRGDSGGLRAFSSTRM